MSTISKKQLARYRSEGERMVREHPKSMSVPKKEPLRTAAITVLGAIHIVVCKGYHGNLNFGNGYEDMIDVMLGCINAAAGAPGARREPSDALTADRPVRGR